MADEGVEMRLKNIFKSSFGKLLLIVIAGVISLIVVRSLKIDFSQITVEKFKETIESWGIWGPVAYIVFYIMRPLILFPAAILSASAGAIWGLKGFLYLQIAANLSANAEFFMARYFARGTVEKFLQGKLGEIDKAIVKRGFLTVLLIRLIPNVAWDIQNLGLGLTKVRFRDYFLATLIGILPGSFALVYFGASLISVLADPKHFWKILLAFVIIGGVFFLQQYLRKRQQGKIQDASNHSTL